MKTLQIFLFSLTLAIFGLFPNALQAQDCTDNDMDGWTDCAGDCNDGDGSIYPGQYDGLNGIDDDCDGSIDEDYVEPDNDGDGWTSSAGDCEDSNPSIYPGAYDGLNGIDDDCDGSYDEDYGGGGDYDNDGDGWTADQGDCDDNNPNVNPGQYDDCDGNGVDDDCDGMQEEDGLTYYYADNDYDSYGDPNNGGLFCWSTVPYNYTYDNSDCNDGDWNIHPGQFDDLNWLDDDCDGSIDEDYVNPDNDFDGWTVDQGDCDDNNPDVNPGQYDDCDGNGVDDDCDGMQDEDGMFYAYADFDYDYYGDTDNGGMFCWSTLPYGYVSDNSDCNDSNASTYPGAMELCDGQDNNCDGNIDEGTTMTFTAAKTHLTCHGVPTGAIDLTVMGGDAPYSYIWSNGSNNEDISDLPASKYRVTVTNANGCTKRSIFIAINQPAVLSATTTVVRTQVSPARYSITVHAAGGVAPPKYQYRRRLLPTGVFSAWQNSNVFLNRTAGTYKVQIKTVSTSGCNLVLTKTVVVPSSMLLAPQETDDELSEYQVSEERDETIAEALGAIGTMQVYPNPASDVLQVVLPDDVDAESKVIVRDMLGRTILEQSVSVADTEQNIVISLAASMPNGLYWVACKTTKGDVLTKQFEVIH